MVSAKGPEYTPVARGYRKCLSGDLIDGKLTKEQEQLCSVCPLKKDHILHLTIWRVIIVCETTTYSTTKSGIVDGRKRYEALSQRTLGIK
ncbi:hypothetical protein BofuT4_P066940.1 [Botrytis cinerea T4]|uniref:Uncharacterized protein n=1 Tax=Botryotinia fuckeliana (strain T4) TaxID=999810 RepID=G2XRB8_BOTF4|nr:hypothetical protein BofuT4_P066940.1 [Botrytis cinerea T4]